MSAGSAAPTSVSRPWRQWASTVAFTLARSASTGSTCPLGRSWSTATSTRRTALTAASVSSSLGADTGSLVSSDGAICSAPAKASISDSRSTEPVIVEQARKILGAQQTLYATIRCGVWPTLAAAGVGCAGSGHQVIEGPQLGYCMTAFKSATVTYGPVGCSTEGTMVRWMVAGAAAVSLLLMIVLGSWDRSFGDLDQRVLPAGDGSGTRSDPQLPADSGEDSGLDRPKKDPPKEVSPPTEERPPTEIPGKKPRPKQADVYE